MCRVSSRPPASSGAMQPTFEVQPLGIETEGAEQRDRRADRTRSGSSRAVTALAGAVAIGIVLTRDIGRLRVDQSTLRGLGVTRGQRGAGDRCSRDLVGGFGRAARGSRRGLGVAAVPARDRSPGRSRCRSACRLDGARDRCRRVAGHGGGHRVRGGVARDENVCRRIESHVRGARRRSSRPRHGPGCHRRRPTGSGWRCRPAAARRRCRSVRRIWVRCSASPGSPPCSCSRPALRTCRTRPGCTGGRST